MRQWTVQSMNLGLGNGSVITMREPLLKYLWIDTRIYVDDIPVVERECELDRDRAKCVDREGILNKQPDVAELYRDNSFHIQCINSSNTCLMLCYMIVPGYECNLRKLSFVTMMTSSNGNIFRVTGPLCGEFTGDRGIPRTKASDAGELWCFLWSASE